MGCGSTGSVGTYTPSSNYGSSTSITQQPDLYFDLHFYAPVIGVGGAKEVARYVVDALEEYAGIGGKIHIQEAVAPVRG